MTLEDFSFINFSNVAYIQQLFEQYQQDPGSVDPSWRYFFEGIAYGQSHLPISCVQTPSLKSAEPFVQRYRRYGHLAAKTNPLEESKPWPQSLTITNDELQAEYETNLYGLNKKAKGKEIVEKLKSIYCSSIGYECNLWQFPEIEKWINKKIEEESPVSFTKDEKKKFFSYFYRADAFENFLHKRYQGKKRFSLEGNDALIPCMVDMLDQCVKHQIQECVIAMAHRGRLNTLTHVMGKEYAKMFHEFEKGYKPPVNEKRGDINYHKGFESKYQNVALTLLPNPSHLESVDPVLEGYTKAKQQKMGKAEQVLPVLIHGDASLAGQGVVYETMQFSRIKGYDTGGTIHIVVNNQIGYTAEEEEGRSTLYCTDLAKTFSCPVFHVNGDDVEACIRVFRLALEVRQKFSIDVFIDLIGYRKYGHNETDEPSFTNPQKYLAIKEKKAPYSSYIEELTSAGAISMEEVHQLEKQVNDEMEEAFKKAKTLVNESEHKPPEKDISILPTNIPLEKIKSYLEILSHPQADFSIHRKVQKIINERAFILSEINNDPFVDWGLAEQLSYASLLDDGYSVRLSGQDSIRGTFAHRHAAIFDQKSKKRHFPLSHIQQNKATFTALNSCLSEYGVMGFEYGFSCADPTTLVIWEGQYGDFANGATICIDQYVSSGEAKWGLKSSLMLFLPHGYEGAGPEHSSARIERYLQLCGDLNMRVAYPSTPAQWFHLIRLAKLTKDPMPHIVITPKAMLRHKPSFSKISEFTNGAFQPVIDSHFVEAPKKVIFCTGKTYYELLMKITEKQKDDIAIIRIEQLYPFPDHEVKTLIEKYRGVSEFVWVQEEHKNMGAYTFIAPRIMNHLPNKQPLLYVGREESASPATGAKYIHDEELNQFIDEALNLKD